MDRPEDQIDNLAPQRVYTRGSNGSTRSDKPEMVSVGADNHGNSVSPTAPTATAGELNLYRTIAAKASRPQVGAEASAEQAGEPLIRRNGVASPDGHIWLWADQSKLTVGTANRFTGEFFGMVSIESDLTEKLDELKALSVVRIGSNGIRAVVWEETRNSVHLLRWPDISDQQSLTMVTWELPAVAAVLFGVSSFLLVKGSIRPFSFNDSMGASAINSQDESSIIDFDAAIWGDYCILLQLRQTGESTVTELQVLPKLRTLKSWPLEDWEQLNLKTNSKGLALVRHPPGNGSQEDPILAAVDDNSVTTCWNAQQLGLKVHS